MDAIAAASAASRAGSVGRKKNGSDLEERGAAEARSRYLDRRDDPAISISSNGAAAFVASTGTPGTGTGSARFLKASRAHFPFPPSLPPLPLFPSLYSSRHE